MIGAECGRILRLDPGRDALSIAALSDGEAVHVRDGSQSVLVRVPRRVSDPVHLDRIDADERAGSTRQIRLRDRGDTVRGRLRSTPDPLGIRFSLEIEANEPPWMVEWTLRGLDFDRILVPALGGQEIGRNMPADTGIAFKYPFWWNAQFAIGMRDAGGLMLHVREADIRLKVLRVARSTDGRFDWTLGVEAPAPLADRALRAEWILSPFAGPYERAADAYRSWMEDAFGLSSWETAGRAPAWLGSIDLVAELWGMHRNTGRPGHTFADMERRLGELADCFPPNRTLVYLPGFAEGGIDSNIPGYRPSPDLGGEAGFASLVEGAHALGYRVMIHTNALGMTFDHPLFDRFRDEQVMDVFGRLQGWGLDMDGDWLPEPYFAYVNPASTAWGDLMEKTIGELVRRYELDAVFLDQTLLAFNVSRGGDFVAGMRRHVERLSRAMPGALFAGEGVHEQVLPALPLVQIHGIDSVTDVHGVEGAAPWRTAHPVSMRVFGPYTRFVAHLLTKTPSDPGFARQNAAYEALGVVPALVYRSAGEPTRSAAMEEVLSQASSLRRAPMEVLLRPAAPLRRRREGTRENRDEP